MQIRSLNTFRKNEDGSIVVIFAVSMLVIILSVALALDASMMRSHKAKLQSTVDAAL